MKVKKVNEFFGYAFFTLGVLKMLLLILVLAKLTSNLNSIASGGNVDLNYYTMFSTIVGFAQLILALGSIIMIILNIKTQPKVIPGYLWAFVALLIEFIMPSIAIVYTSFIASGIYMKSGIAIRNKNLGYEKNYSQRKKEIANTDWFYSDKNK